MVIVSSIGKLGYLNINYESFTYGLGPVTLVSECDT